jgi:hypothetical protein
MQAMVMKVACHARGECDSTMDEVLAWLAALVENEPYGDGDMHVT